MKINYYVVFLYIFIIVLPIFSKPADIYFRKYFSNSEKSLVLSQKGVDLYTKELKNKKNYDAVPFIRDFFISALYLDINNKQAIDYLKLTNEFKIYNFRDNYETAIYYYNLLVNMEETNPKREQTTFNACYYLQNALVVDSKNSLIDDLKKNLAPMLKQLQSIYLKRGNEIKDKIKKTNDQKEKSDLAFEGYRNYGKALLLDPNNNSAQKEKAAFQQTLLDSMKAIYDEAIVLIEKNDFTEVDNKIKILSAISNQADHLYKDDINKLYSKKLLGEAKFYFSKNNLSLAKKKVVSALNIEKNQELIDLKKSIDIEIAKKTAVLENATASATTANEIKSIITEIDELLALNEIALVKNRIDAFLKSTTDNTLIAELKKRLAIANEASKTTVQALYDKAVDFYNNEQFDQAIEIFSEIMDLDSSYQNAKEYLDKAIAKKKALEAF